MKNENLTIEEEFVCLKPYQQAKVLQFLETFQEINSIDPSREASKGMVCRKCGSGSFVKNGHYHGTARFKCKTCHSTQAKDANTPVSMLKLKDKWVDYTFIMLDPDCPKNVGYISSQLDIDTKTAFRWRHRFLSSLNSVNPLALSEETEMDEVFLPFTVKGVIGREKYKEYFGLDHPDNVETEFRIEEKYKEEEGFQAVFLCVHNREQDFDFRPIKVHKNGSVSQDDLSGAARGIELKDKTVITDSGASMKAFLGEIEGVNHLTFRSSDMKRGVIEDKSVHNNNINNTMMLFKRWIKGFCGVSTKYIWNYLKWFRFIKLFKAFNLREIVEFTVQDKQAYPRYKDIFNDYVALVHS